ncbi:amidohydrolase family protein [Bradyrhizobium sp. HKCCYLR20261]|uniref:amidohydrolase family protein n=1 Tax=Bradyrhizobium sp. HKCCYLR20261 TaxID=3420760 RepID=UPI003EB9337F
MSDNLIAALKRDRFVLKPDLLLTANGPQRDLALVVEGSTVVSAGPAAELDAADQAAALTLDGHAIIPGFTDAHTHLGQTFGKILIGGEPAQIWRRLWVPMEAGIDDEAAYVSAKWQFLEQLRGGFTGVVNYALNDAARNAAVHRAAEETGIRLRSSTGLDEVATDADPNGERVPLARILDRIDEHIAQTSALPRITPSVSSGSFFGNRPETLAAISEHAKKRGIIYQLHANEHFPEVHDSILQFGKRPLELLAEHGVLGPHVLIHHATLATDREVALLQKTDAAVAYNPVASEWKGNAVAPALAFAAHGVRFGLGSDNTRFDGFRTLDAAEHAQRLTYGLRTADFSAGAGWTWVDAITRGSADAAGWSDVGVLSAGARADFLVLDMERPETQPSWDFEWELVRYYNRDQIAAVVVDGRPVLAAGQPVDWDGREFLRRYRALGQRVGSLPGITRVHGASDRYRPKVS